MFIKLLERLGWAWRAAPGATRSDPLSRFLSRKYELLNQPYSSRYGGLWIDHPDAEDIAARLAATKAISGLEHDLIVSFIINGFVVLNQAIDSALIDRFRAEMDGLWRTGHGELTLSLPPTDTRVALHPKHASIVGARVLDIYRHLESARHLLLNDAITRFLRIVFNRSPLLFQSLSFSIGSEQGMHQDTAYVVTDSPMKLAASWIALEDIAEGSGELQFYVGSHRLPEYHFGGQRKHFTPGLDPPTEHDEYQQLIVENAIRMGCRLDRFVARKGDVLIWHADLAHGGSPIANRQTTRQSLVGHYCPNDVRPNYFGYLPGASTIWPFRGGAYCSGVYQRPEASPVKP